MRKVINGRMYNTETAEAIDNNGLNLGIGNFRNFKETLYRKKTGEFFLCGEGGPLSKYRVSDGGSGWYDGSAIIPLSLIEAREWVEEYSDVDTYIELFGDPEE